MKTLVSGWLLLLAGQVLAAGADFARGRIVETGTDSVAFRLVLPRDVYEWVVRSDLGDVRVLNDSGEEVPFTLSRPKSTDEHTPWMAQPVFLLPGTEAGTRSGARINVQVDDNGAVIAVDGDLAGAAHTSSVLVDTGGFEGKPTELQLGWSPAGEDFVGRIRIQASDDLNEWRTLVSSATVALLRSDGHDVRVDRLDLPGKRARYLKITQLEGNEAFAVNDVALRSRRQQLPAREWKTLNASRVDEGYEFVTGGWFPLDRVLVEADRESYLMVGRLFSRSEASQPWRSRGTHTFYHTAIAGITAAADPVVVATRDQHWRLEIDDYAALEPTLRIGWLPDGLVFLEQGSAPFLLAYGRAGLEGRHWPVRDLLDRMGQRTELSDLPVASLGEPILLGGPGRLVPPPAPLDWHTIVLWAVLVLGVLVVGGFAWRLLKG